MYLGETGVAYDVWRSGRPWMERTASRIGVALAALAALTAAALWILDQATFVTTTDALVPARGARVSADDTGRLADVLAAPGGRLRHGEVLARLDDRRARPALAEASPALKALKIAIGPETLNADVSRECGGQRVVGRRSGLDLATANANAMRHAGGRLASAAPAATPLAQTGSAPGVALLSALLTQRTAFHSHALLQLVSIGGLDGSVGLREVLQTV